MISYRCRRAVSIGVFEEVEGNMSNTSDMSNTLDATTTKEENLNQLAQIKDMKVNKNY